jgi:hypothetical protein
MQFVMIPHLHIMTLAFQYSNSDSGPLSTTFGIAVLMLVLISTFNLVMKQKDTPQIAVLVFTRSQFGMSEVPMICTWPPCHGCDL